MGKDPVGTVRGHYLLIGAVVAVTVLAGALCFGADEAALFERAYGSFMSYQPEKAVEGFNAFIREYPSSSALDAAFFWKAKALAVTGRTAEAREIISSFDEKFPESPFRQFTRSALAEMKVAGEQSVARTPETRGDKNNKAGKALTEKVRVLEARVAGLDSENKKLKKSMDKSADEKNLLAKQLDEARQRAGELSEKVTAAEEKTVLESRVKELEVRLAAAAEDTRRAEEKARLLALERDDALASGRAGTDRLSPTPAAGALMEREKELREFNEYVRRVKELESEKKSLQERWDRYRQEKEAELKGLAANRGGAPRQTSSSDQQEKELADLRKRLADAEQKAGETVARQKAAADEKTLADLRRRLAEFEQKASEAAVREKAAVEERALLASRLRDAEQKLAGLASMRDTAEREGARARRAEEERDRLRKEMKGAMQRQKRTAENAGLRLTEDIHVVKNRELTEENISLRERLARFERPVVKVAGKTYSQAQIDEDRAVAAKVLGLVQASPVSWHSGNSYEDFVAEQVLLARAGKDELQKLAGEAATLAKKHSFTAQEQGYLLRFLAAEAQVRKRKAYPGDEDLRNYYDAHRNEFAAGKGERMVQYLALQQGSGDKASGVQLVSELQREAMSGKPLEEIARSRGGRVSYTRARMTEIPSWIGDKVKRLREGEISSLFTEDQFIMLQVVTQRDARSFDEVKGEIRTLLTGREKDLAAWLADIRKEAEDLR